MGTQVRNTSQVPLTLPSPFKGVLAAGDAFSINRSVASVLALIGPHAGLAVSESLDSATDFSYVPDDFPGDPTTKPPPAVGATQTYVEATATYTSSIDSSLTDLVYSYCYDRGIAARRNLPIVVIVPPYDGGSATINAATRRRIASDYGVAVLVVGMRGRDGSSGDRDDGGREVYDVYDALFAFRAALPLVVSPTIAFAGPAWSGGGGIVLQLMCKFPDTFCGYFAFFPITDYGKDSVDSFWALRGSDVRATLIESIGNRATVTAPYRARNAVEAGGKILALEGAPTLYLFWDSADTSVPSGSRFYEAVVGAGGGDKMRYYQSEPTDQLRWLHGLPADIPQLVQGEYRFAERLQRGAAWEVPASGRVVVLGYMKTSRFEIWLGNTTDFDADTPIKTTAGGGVDCSAELFYDEASKTYYVTPLTGSCWVEIRRGTQVVRREATGPMSIDTEDLTAISGLEALGATHEWRCDQGLTLAGSDVSQWDDQIGTAHWVAAANRPEYMADYGDGMPAVVFASASSECMTYAGNLFDVSQAHTVAMVLRKDTAGARCAFAQQSATGNGYSRIYKGDGFAIADFHDNAASFVEKGMPQADSLFYVQIFTWEPGGGEDGDDLLTNRVNGLAGTAEGPTGTVTTDRSSLGAFNPAAGKQLFWGGPIAHVATFPYAVAASDASAIEGYFRSIWGARVP